MVQVLSRRETVKRARGLRRDMTDSERMLWSRLRAKRLDGFKFRRQHPILRFFADFCCISRRLVVELDGPSHVGRGSYDAMRDRMMGEAGYRVSRFPNERVWSDMDRVLAEIRAHLSTEPEAEAA